MAHIAKAERLEEHGPVSSAPDEDPSPQPLEPIEERVGRQLTDALKRIRQPPGLAVHLEAVHLGTQRRGVCEIESSTRTTY